MKNFSPLGLVGIVALLILAIFGFAQGYSTISNIGLLVADVMLVWLVWHRGQEKAKQATKTKRPAPRKR